MAEKQRMTGEEVVRWLLADDGADPVRESLKWMAQELMEAEVSGLVGAELGKRTEDRATHRNGYRPRRWDARAGELEELGKRIDAVYFSKRHADARASITGTRHDRLDAVSVRTQTLSRYS